MFLDVGFDGQEILVDEIGGFLVFVGVGIQPSTGTSGRSRTEVQQNGAALLFRCDERLIDVLAPIHSHNSPPGAMIKYKNLGENSFCSARSADSRRNRGSRSQPLLHLVMAYYARLLRHDTATREDDEVRYSANIEAGSNLRVLFCVHFQH